MTQENKTECCSTGKSCCGPKGLITALAIIVAIGALVYAGSVKRESLSLNKEPAKAVDASSLIKGDDAVVAKLNGDDIHKSDVAMAIHELGANVPPESVDQILPAFLDQYINLRLLSDAARDEGIANDPEVKAQFYNARDQIMRAAYLRKLFEGKISDDVLHAAYKAKYEDQPMPQEVHARHILVDSEAKARDLIAQLKAGADFAKLAEANSKDPTAKRGGDLGYFTKAEMVKEFGDAAFAMAPGQVSSNPVKTQFGWHVIKVEDKRTRAKPTFEEAKGQLEQEARQAILDAKLADLRKDAKVEIVSPAAAPGAAEPA
jgi:peptidyl-prolyl cis-trans isomerase C